MIGIGYFPGNRPQTPKAVTPTPSKPPSQGSAVDLDVSASTASGLAAPPCPNPAKRIKVCIHAGPRVLVLAPRVACALRPRLSRNRPIPKIICQAGVWYCAPPHPPCMCVPYSPTHCSHLQLDFNEENDVSDLLDGLGDADWDDDSD